MLLYQPFKIRSLELPNRWVMSPMCMYMAEAGVPNDFHFVHYVSRAQGGVGLIVVEATGVEPKGRITPRCLGLWNDEQEAALKHIVDHIHQHTETKISIQLNHSGRKGSTLSGVQVKPEAGGWLPAGPSAIPYQPSDATPTVLTLEDIKNSVELFRQSTIRALRAGFDMIEIHAAHGYLLHQFLSPISNQRNDNYGGSFENRIRLLLEVVDAVRAEIPESMPLMVRLSGTEYADPAGWDIDESAQLSAILLEKGVDIVDVSSGGNIYNATTTPYSTFHNQLSSQIKAASGIAAATVGLIDNADKAEEILQSGDADLIFVGRALLRNPYLPVLESFRLNEECAFPKPYLRGKPLQ